MKATMILKKIDNGIIVENKGKSIYYGNIKEAIEATLALSDSVVFQFGNKKETIITVELSELVHNI